MATGVPIFPSGFDSDATLGPTSGIVAGTTHLGDAGTNQGDQLGITRNLIAAIMALQANLAPGNAGTFTVGTYTQGAIGVGKQITVIDTSWMLRGTLLYIKSDVGNVGGFYIIQSVDTSTLVTITNLGVPSNSAAGATIPALSAVQPFGCGTGPQVDSVSLFEEEEDFTETTPLSASAPNARWSFSSTGTATCAPANPSPSVVVPVLGALDMETGATAVSVGSLCKRNLLVPQNTAIDLAFSVYIPVLSVSGTQDYVFAVGLTQNPAAASVMASPFMGVGYALNTGSINWVVLTGSSVEANFASTGVPVAVNTIYHVRLNIPLNWTSLNVMINHGPTTTVSTNIPTSDLYPVIILSSSTGALTKSAFIDRVKTRIFTIR